MGYSTCALCVNDDLMHKTHKCLMWMFLNCANIFAIKSYLLVVCPLWLVGSILSFSASLHIRMDLTFMCYPWSHTHSIFHHRSEYESQLFYASDNCRYIITICMYNTITHGSSIHFSISFQAKVYKISRHEKGDDWNLTYIKIAANVLLEIVGGIIKLVFICCNGNRVYMNSNVKYFAILAALIHFWCNMKCGLMHGSWNHCFCFFFFLPFWIVWMGLRCPTIDESHQFSIISNDNS